MKTTSSWGLVLSALVSALFTVGCTSGNGPLLARPNTQAVKTQSARQALGGNGLATQAQFDAPVIDANSSSAPAFGTGSYSVAPNVTGGPSSLGAIDASSSPAYQYVIVGDLAGNPQSFFAVIADVPFVVGTHAVDNVHYFAGLFDAATGNPTHLASSGTVSFALAGGVGGRFLGTFVGTIEAVASGCQSTADCAAGEICSNGTCVTSPPPQCRADADCARGEVCQAGLCVLATPPPQCTSNAQCASGQVCQSGVCVTTTPPPQCLADADCASGETCQRGVCVASTPPQCTSSNQCPLGWSCTRGQCVPGSTPSQCEGQQGDGAFSGQVSSVTSCAALPSGSVSLSQGVAVIDEQLRLVVFDGTTGDEGVMLELAVCPGAVGTLSLGQGLVAASHVKDVQTADLRLFAERRASSATLTLSAVSPSLAGSFSLTLATGGQVNGSFTMY